MRHVKLTYVQYANWRNAILLNPWMRGNLPALRSLYRSVRSGETYGQFSGYSP